MGMLDLIADQIKAYRDWFNRTTTGEANEGYNHLLRILESMRIVLQQHAPQTKMTYLGESGSHYILKIEGEDGLIGIGELRKCRQEWAAKYYWDEEEPPKSTSRLIE